MIRIFVKSILEYSKWHVKAQDLIGVILKNSVEKCLP